MEENKSLWNKTIQDLTVKDQIKVSLAAPVITMAVLLGPLVIWGKISDIRERRRNANKEIVLVTADTTEPEEE